MRIKQLYIRNFKSLVDFKLENLPSFAAVVGPNASGKSNIFEALEFTNYVCRFPYEATSFFGGLKNIYSYQAPLRSNLSFHYQFDDNLKIKFELLPTPQRKIASFDDAYGIGHDPVLDLEEEKFSFLDIRDKLKRANFLEILKKKQLPYNNEFEIFIDNFSRLFVGKNFLNRSSQLQSRLHTDASNLSQILAQIFEDNEKKDEFVEWLRILIPEFNDIEIRKSNLDGSSEFFLYEKTSDRPFSKHLISDGTNNILALMAVVFQTDSPQFLCIEEPENGLHPQAIELLVDFLREKSEEKGHHILLNTHSRTLVRCLEPQEIILVNKVNGATIAKQLTKGDAVNIKTDEAWLTNAFGGGVL
ncbi:ATP-binding protein [Chitinophaga filiformis]|uniref:AAA family ATPase n=1 Tax=Chitinophaga filiformis TaxID=104663 RepID=UPI001F3C408F|nr:ATP-binding protein [Chitinophaga filiformis]MCF6406997.1 ATP-binding protein [Chitinophaga filiformis]